MTWAEKRRAYLGTAGIKEGARVRIKPTTTTTPPEVELAGEDETGIGIAMRDAGAGDQVAVRAYRDGGTHEMIAIKAIVVGSALYAAPNGKITDTSTLDNVPLNAFLVSASAADGDIVEVTFI